MKKLVLSVSGGGALGIGPLQFMKRLEADLNKPLHEICEAYAGTSTGSIIVSGICKSKSGPGKTASELFDLYKNNLEKIFKKRGVLDLSKATNYYKYLNSGLKKMLYEIFEGKMDKFGKPIFIPTTYMNGKSTEKVWDRSDDWMDRAFAILSSCSAPTYFDSLTLDGQMYCDGGMWANDPIMVLVAGLSRLRKKDREVAKTFADGFKVLSFNTGMVPPNKGPSNKSILGWLTYIIDEWVARTGNSNLFEAREVIGAENVFRCEPKVSKSYAMDDLKITNDIVKIWDEYYDSYDEEEEKKKKGKKTVGQKVCQFVRSTME